MTPHHSGKAAFTVTRWLWVDGSAHESGAKNPKATNILCDEDTESQMCKVDEGWETANDAEITDVQKAAENTNSPKSSCLASTRRFTEFVCSFRSRLHTCGNKHSTTKFRSFISLSPDSSRTQQAEPDFEGSGEWRTCCVCPRQLKHSRSSVMAVHDEGINQHRGSISFMQMD